MSEQKLTAKDVLDDICANPSRFENATKIVLILGPKSEEATILAKFDEDSVSIARGNVIYHIKFNQKDEITGFIGERLSPPAPHPETPAPPNQQ